MDSTEPVAQLDEDIKEATENAPDAAGILILGF